MLQALKFASIDSINVLLIGVLIAIGITVPRRQYRYIVPLVVLGDWLGVFGLSSLLLFLFQGVAEPIQSFINSIWFGVILILTGLITGVMTAFGGNETGELVQKLMTPLEKPSLKTVGMGLLLGVVQSATSVPFYSGLLFLAGESFTGQDRVVGLILYATVALSLPAICAVGIAVVRLYPHSIFGVLFYKAKKHHMKLALYAAYAVSVFLMLIGIAHILGA